MEIKQRVEKLREIMKKKGVDAYIVPSADFHGSEYVAEYFKARAWISGFTGSAGTIVITLEDAGLWTDGRYYIQAAEQLKDSGIRLVRAADPGVPSYVEWLKSTLKENAVVGFDGRTVFVNEYKGMIEAFASKNIGLKINEDLIGEIWTDRPAMPMTKVFIHDVKYTGKSRREKISEVVCEMKKKFAQNYVLSSLDDIAWLLNIRGRDVKFNPVTISHVTLNDKEECTLFIEGEKLEAAVRAELEKDGIVIKEYNEIEKALAEVSGSIFFDPTKTNASLFSALKEDVKKFEGVNITTIFKGKKNDVEIANSRNSQERDCAAVFKFMHWLKKNVSKMEITEIMAEEKIVEFRSQMENFVEPSFDVIAGHREHAAIMHYKATPETQYTLKPEGFLLIDSGGQYYDGTTDITRTMVLGPITDIQKRDFTLVLKGVINLSIEKFLYGTTGSNIDIIARRQLWAHGINYACGTGHGIGYFLNVHEGPHRIAPIMNPTILEKGMFITNEPGVYKEGEYGIRLENVLAVVEDEESKYAGKFMKFETLTYCPIDLDGVNPELLTEVERKWLNDYHKTTFEKLSKFVEGEELEFLKHATREI